ncbi:hypothetical protein Aperf_G00000088795 [Anoplocephala perfoliata]
MSRIPLQGTYDVKIGQSFTDPSQNGFMTMRCDFLPASVDREQPGQVKITNEKDVDVRLPNVSGADHPSTLFKGNLRQATKECVLIFNKTTGELTLERISKSAQMKNIRDAPPVKKQPEPQLPISQSSQSSSNAPQLSSSKPKVRSMSDSSSGSDARRPKSRPEKPPTQKSLTQSSNSKRSILPSSSSSSSSSSLNLHDGGTTSPIRKPRLEQPDSLSSLSDLDDMPPVIPQATNSSALIKPAVSTSQTSASMQRALIAHDLNLSESESDDDDDDPS